MKQIPLPQQYDHAQTEARLQQQWLERGVYHWHNDAPREQTYVIDTPPPTVSGHLHMGHVFSYVQADIIARYQRMKGMDVFYPMGFDDNGLPTERLVEKEKKKRAVDYPSREEFIAVCEEVSETARKDFRQLFQSLALSVDWRQEYHTISEECRRLSQQSFLDLLEKGHIERRLEPMLWDPIDQTAIAQAEIEDKELDSFWNDIWFGIDGSDQKILIGTTRPELIPACVAIFYHPDDARYQHLKGKHAITPLFGVRVPILEDDSVDPEKGTGIMMCCTFGDEADIEKWRKHDLDLRAVITKYGKFSFHAKYHGKNAYYVINDFNKIEASILSEIENDPTNLVIQFTPYDEIVFSAKYEKISIQSEQSANIFQCFNYMREISGLKIINARKRVLELLSESRELEVSKPITHAVKCAERSGAPLEILLTNQWFVKITNKKDELRTRARECSWYPEWMRLRLEQWIDGLNWDWCISRQRYYGVPFPIWYMHKINLGGTSKIETRYPDANDLPINPLSGPPKGFEIKSHVKDQDGHDRPNEWIVTEKFTGDEYFCTPDADVMDTWATSSLTPQINARAINSSSCGQPQAGAQDLTDSVQSLRDSQNGRFSQLFPADLRPQAHEIIRTWAFYTIVKSHLHNDMIPWKNLMISGWCLAEDKSKMSKSKGNVVTPHDLIAQHSTDAVRYWAATSRLGQDTAFSTDLLKIGRKLVTKLWNATKFAAIHLDKLPDDYPPLNLPPQGGEAAQAAEGGAVHITETLDRWILSRLHQSISKATEAFEKYEYADALRAAEDFFWNDFCDNYLELVKARVYGNSPSPQPSPEGEGAQNTPLLGERVAAQPSGEGQLSAAATIYHCLDGILRLFAPFIPHITEELYSHIFAGCFAERGSLHGRHNWPNAAAYPYDAASEQAGIAAVELLEAIRKAKSERGVSIKYPIERLVISYPPLNLPPQGGEAAHAAEGGMLTPSLLADLAGAGNIEHISVAASAEGGITTESGRFSLAITFAESAEVG